MDNIKTITPKYIIYLTYIDFKFYNCSYRKFLFSFMNQLYNFQVDHNLIKIIFNLLYIFNLKNEFF